MSVEKRPRRLPSTKSTESPSRPELRSTDVNRKLARPRVASYVVSKKGGGSRVGSRIGKAVQSVSAGGVFGGRSSLVRSPDVHVSGGTRDVSPWN